MTALLTRVLFSGVVWSLRFTIYNPEVFNESLNFICMFFDGTIRYLMEGY